MNCYQWQIMKGNLIIKSKLQANEVSPASTNIEIE